MSPSSNSKVITKGQIDKAVSKYRALLEKHGSKFDSEAVQAVLGSSKFAGEMFATFRRRVEAQSEMPVRHIAVDLKCTPSEALDVTGYRRHIDQEVLDSMPKAETDSATVYFFRVGRQVSDVALEKEYKLRGLKPCDPITLMTLHQSDPSFVDSHSNGTHWQDANGDWCFVSFELSTVERYVIVGLSEDVWNSRWWFAGVRK